jgi:hypothetical protein
MDELTIYMPLLDGGTDVWRPVRAEPLGPDCYRILGNVPADEKWPYGPNSLVRCAHKKFADGSSGLVPVSVYKP